MASKKISELDSKDTITGTEELEINDSGTSKKIKSLLLKPTSLLGFIIVTDSQTYTPNSNITQFLIKMCGGGGGSRGTGRDTGGGGGAGGYLEALIKIVPGIQYTATIGAGGTENQDGTDTILITPTKTYTAGGGNSGKDGNALARGGMGGISTNGDYNVRGNAGKSGFDAIATDNGIYSSGQGGESKLGSPGNERDNRTSDFVNQSPSYGSGGSGGHRVGGHSGQTGAKGVLIVYEYGYE